ncbi:MAG: hypothetical protein M3443_09045, partial [Actinomycetota bacterium]|nr:hypothetical protein [Actinomycetota bacterium]
ATLIRADYEAAHSDPRRRAWISALLARASAASGDEDMSRRALDAARGHIDAATEPPSGTDFFDAARLDGVAGTTYLLLRDTAHAAPLLSAALDRRAPEDRKGRALLGIDLAECHIHDGDAHEAANLVITALDWADGAMVEPVVARARAVRDTLTRAAGTDSARELNERLQETSRGQ